MGFRRQSASSGFFTLPNLPRRPDPNFSDTGMARHPSPPPSSESEHSKDEKPARKSDRSPDSRPKAPENSGAKSGRRLERCRRESPDGREDDEERRSRRADKVRRKSRSRSRRSSSSESGSGSEYSSSDGSSESESEYSESDSEEERRRRRRKRRERMRREDDEEERRRRRRKREKERKRRKRERDEDIDDDDSDRKKRKSKDKKKKKEKKKKKDERAARGKTGAVTNSWGKYGIIRETDMWNKRPEFTAWLAEVKQVNLEGLANWEEKQIFKEFMEDHNTATFPSKKYYNLDAYHRRQMEKDLKRGLKKVVAKERTIFNDEEQRRQEMMLAREKQKEEEVEALKRSMQDGMAQAMKDQARLREEMAYQYKLGNFEAAAAIQRRLDPNIAM